MSNALWLMVVAICPTPFPHESFGTGCYRPEAVLRDVSRILRAIQGKMAVFVAYPPRHGRLRSTLETLGCYRPKAYDLQRTFSALQFRQVGRQTHARTPVPACVSDTIPEHSAVNDFSIKIYPIIGMVLVTGFLDRAVDQARVLWSLVAVHKGSHVPGVLV